MGEQATQEKVEAAGSQPATPEVKPNPQPDPAVVDLQRQLDEVKKQLADKDRHITDLANEKSTLEARLTQTQPQAPETIIPDNIDKEIKEALEIAYTDSATAGTKLATLIKNSVSNVRKETLESLQGQLQPAIENITYANEVKSKNQDLIDLGFEPVISAKVTSGIQSGKYNTFKEAVDAAIKETREKVDKIKSNAPPTPPPKNALGEEGANKLPTPPPPPVQETQDSEIARRLAKRARAGL